MSNKGKRYIDAAEAVRPARGCTRRSRRVDLVKSLATAKFDETIELAVRLGVDPRRADQIVRGLAGAAGRHRQDHRVAVFAAGEAADEARAAGADVVGADDLVARIEKEGSSTSTSPSPRPTSWPRSAGSAACSGPAGSCPTRRRDGHDRRRPGGDRVQGRPGRVPDRPRRATSTCRSARPPSSATQLLDNFRAVIDELQGEARRRQGPLHPLGHAVLDAWARASSRPGPLRITDEELAATA